MERRRFLQAAALGMSTAIAGCSSSSSTADDPQNGNDQNQPQTETSESSKGDYPDYVTVNNQISELTVTSLEIDTLYVKFEVENTGDKTTEMANYRVAWTAKNDSGNILRETDDEYLSGRTEIKPQTKRIIEMSHSFDAERVGEFELTITCPGEDAYSDAAYCTN